MDKKEKAMLKKKVYAQKLCPLIIALPVRSMWLKMVGQIVLQTNKKIAFASTIH